MGSGFEEGTYRRADLVIDKERLNAAPKRPSQWFRPQLDSRDYNPLTGKEADSGDVHRQERPTQGEQEERWGQR